MLVVVQFTSMTILVGTGPVLSLQPYLLALQLAALVLGGWAVLTVGIGRFNIRPEPKPTAQLKTSGPYQWIRHPMYASLLLFFVVVVGMHPTWPRLAVYFLLLCNILIKLGYEESLLMDHFPEYAVYRKQTAKLIPFIY